MLNSRVASLSAGCRAIGRKPAHHAASVPTKADPPAAWKADAGAAATQEGPTTSGRDSGNGGGAEGTRWRPGRGRSLMLPAFAAAALFGTAAFSQELLPTGPPQPVPLPPDRHPLLREAADWVAELATEDNVELALTAASMDQHPVLRGEHMFSSLVEHAMVRDLMCFYNVRQRRFYYILQLGSGVCGYPRILHGGLTAAFVDEAFGFLFYSLRRHRQLPFVGPAFTRHLEVNYERKIQATPGRLLLCVVEVESIEGRKLWMRATVREGPQGKVYATGRALFVAPKLQRLLHDGLKYLTSGLVNPKISFE